MVFIVMNVVHKVHSLNDKWSKVDVFQSVCFQLSNERQDYVLWVEAGLFSLQSNT
jgi:hypothetical protein